MAGGGAVVNQRSTFFGFEKLCNVCRSDLHLERSRDSVERFEPLAGEVLPMLMQVDESRSDDKACGLNDAASGQGFCGDTEDFSVAYANVADRVKTSLGIHDASTLHNHVILLS
jgi:hypothetical protein